MTRLFAVFCLSLILTALQTTPAVAENCADDKLTWIKGADECMALKTFGADQGARTLLVFNHGDGSRGGPSDYLYKHAEKYGRNGVVAVGLIRPGYFDSDGNTSTGTSYRRAGDSYRPWVVDAVAGAIAALKAHHGVARVVLVGHSGGAAISGVILGRHPGLANAAVLAACPCDVPEWRWMRRGKNNWTSSLSPHDFTGDIPAGTRVIAVTGADDGNTKSVLAEKYVERLIARGISAEFVEVPNASHNGVTGTDAFFQAIEQLLK